MLNGGLLALAEARKELGEDYLEFYQRLEQHQTELLLKSGCRVGCELLDEDERLTYSHQNLICVLWLLNMHSNLPRLVATRYSEVLERGTQLIDLVPELSQVLDDLLQIADSDQPKVKPDLGSGVSQTNGGTQKDVFGLESVGKLEDVKLSAHHPEDLVATDIESFLEDIKLEIPPLECEDEVKVEKENVEKKKSVVKKARKKLKKETGGTKFYCDLCSYISATTRSYREHRRIKHGVREFLCVSCKIFFSQSSDYRLHKEADRMKKKESAAVLTCPECEFTTKKPDTMKNHAFKFHSKGEGFSCDQCDYRTLHLRKLKEHIASIHQNIKGFVCSDCGAAYVRNCDLTEHVRTAHEGFRYLCDQCDFRSKKRNVLGKHVKQMHGAKSYACSLCLFKAACQLHLRNHMITVHEDVHFYPCDQCDYNARRPVLLKEHKQSKHLGIWITCKLCDHRAKRKWHMKRHMMKIHKLEDDAF